MGADFIEESGTSRELRRRHNGYFAGSFSGVPCPSPRELVQLARDLQRLGGDDATWAGHR